MTHTVSYNIARLWSKI